MGKKKNVDQPMTEDTIKIVASPNEDETSLETATDQENQEDGEQAEEAPAQKTKKVSGNLARRSKKYQLVRSKVDKTKLYEPTAAIELIKKLSYSKFPGTIEAHVITRKEGTSVTLSYPYSTGKKVVVAVFSAELAEKIAAGQIEFDILVATPADMPKITKFARILGPKGLMPNPKTGTLVDDPAARAKELSGGQVTIKTEKKAPLMHTVLGKTTMDTQELVANLAALMAATKNDALKMHLSASMSPSVRVDLTVAE